MKKVGTMMKQALLVIDVQNDYFPTGKMELRHPEMALQNIKQLENYFFNHDLPIIYIQHIKHEPKATFFQVGTQGVKLHKDLKANAKSIIIEKHFPNSFYRTNLEQTLYALGVEQLVICGMMTQMCVDSTTRASNELQFNPILIKDAVATKDLTFDGKTIKADAVQASFLASLSNFACISSTAEFLR